MRSKQLNLDDYETDKIRFGYLDAYDKILVPWVDKSVTLLELGVYRGGSLKLWRDYFPRGTIIGIDRKLPEHFVRGERIHIFEGNQADKAFLSAVANETAPDGFDIIIDDASHIGKKVKRTFWHLFDHYLKSGGLYAIEDWGTGYQDDFPDGKRFNPKPSILNRVRSLLPQRLAKQLKVPFPSHSYGMVGFIKELVDEQGAGSITIGRKEEFRLSKIESLVITPGIVFVTKMAPTLSASPNPVPAGEGLGRTTVSWNSVDGKIYVSENGRDEVLFADSPRDSQVADWIGAGSSYEFRLYNSDHTELLQKMVVTKTTQ
jgi:hypothetical protein